MKITKINTTPSFGTQYNKNLESVVYKLAKKGYPKLEQKHLDVLKRLQNDGINSTSLNLEYSLFGNPKLILESKTLAKASNLVEEIMESLREHYLSLDGRIVDASVNLALKTKELLNAISGEFEYDEDFVNTGIDLSREDEPSKLECMLGLDEYPFSVDKLLDALSPDNKDISIDIKNYHKNLEYNYNTVLQEFMDYNSIVNSN